MDTILRQERKKRNGLQRDVADQIGITTTAYTKIETGKRRPSFGVLVKIEDLFGMDYRELFDLPQRRLRDNTGRKG